MREPSVMITDYILSLLSLYWGIRFFRRGRNYGQYEDYLWALMYLSVSLGAVLGGTHHGFIEKLHPIVSIVFWKSTLIAIGVAGLALMLVWNLKFSRLIGRGFLNAISLVYFCIYIGLTLFKNEFYFVVGYYFPIVIVVMVSSFVEYKRNRDKRYLAIGWGMALALGGSIFQVAGLDIHRYFTKSDVYHAVQMVGLYTIYRGYFYLKN